MTASWKRFRARSTQLLHGVVALTGAMAALAVFLLMVTVLANVLMRFIFDSPLSGSLELTQYWWMILVSAGGWALAEHRNEHIEASILYDLQSPHLKRVWLMVGRVLSLIVMGMIAYFGIQSARSAQEVGEFAGPTELPLWPMRYWVAIGAAVYALLLLQRVFTVKQDVSEGPVPDDDTIDVPSSGAI